MSDDGWSVGGAFREPYCGRAPRAFENACAAIDRRDDRIAEMEARRANLWQTAEDRGIALERAETEVERLRGALRDLLSAVTVATLDGNKPEMTIDPSDLVGGAVDRARAILDGKGGDAKEEMVAALDEARRVVQPIIEAERAAANRHVDDIVLRGDGGGVR